MRQAHYQVARVDSHLVGRAASNGFALYLSPTP
jgi:hypothetical protein